MEAGREPGFFVSGVRLRIALRHALPARGVEAVALRQLGSDRQQVLTLAAVVEQLQRAAMPPDLAVAAEAEAQA